MSLPTNVKRVLDSILGHAGFLDQNKRQSVFDFAQAAAGISIEHEAIPAELLPFVEKVVQSPYKVVDRDIEQLKTIGYNEDQIYEMTIAIALGAGTGRLALTQRLIEENDQ